VLSDARRINQRKIMRRHPRNDQISGAMALEDPVVVRRIAVGQMPMAGGKQLFTECRKCARFPEAHQFRFD